MKLRVSLVSKPSSVVPFYTVSSSHMQSSGLEVMDYIPATQFMPVNYFWPDIDSSIRKAAFRGVQIQLLISKWNYSDPIMFPYLNSLATLPNVTVQLFEVPPIPHQEQQVPYTRVNHAKFFVTDKSTYIGTSNWAGDYFINTGGNLWYFLQ